MVMRKVSLMFSGGVDSTTAALKLAETYDEVHLLSFSNGYGHTRIERTRRRLDELRRHAGDRFFHTVESVQPLFEMILDDPRGDFRRYGSGFIWCLSCKLAMHTRGILYNLERQIPHMADGSSQSTGEMVEQTLLAIYMVRELYERYGIRYRTPVYTIPRASEIESLKERGFKMGMRILDRFLGIQPTCRPGELYYLPFLVLNQPPKHDEEKVARFIELKSEVAHAHVARVCAERGLPTSIEDDEGGS